MPLSLGGTVYSFITAALGHSKRYGCPIFFCLDIAKDVAVLSFYVSSIFPFLNLTLTAEIFSIAKVSFSNKSSV